MINWPGMTTRCVGCGHEWVMEQKEQPSSSGPIATPGANLCGEASIPSEASRPRELLTSKIESIRRELVALKRSIDPHISDPRRYEILRDDLNPIWGRLEALLHADETPALIPVKDEREIEELRAALKVARQALMEFSHAQECGPQWYTRGESGMYAQVRLWMRRGHEAISKALGPYDENGRYLKEMPAVEPGAGRVDRRTRLGCTCPDYEAIHREGCPARGKDIGPEKARACTCGAAERGLLSHVHTCPAVSEREGQS